MTVGRIGATSGKRALCALLDQQCWLWGQDVQRPAGNLLLEYGMERRRPPAGISGCSQYSAVGAGLEVRLWGFGVYFKQSEKAEGVYVNRFEGVVRRALELPDFSLVKEMAGLPRGGRSELLAAGIDWIAAYEGWVLARLGEPYRQQCLQARGRAAATPAGQMVTRWEALARSLRTPHV